MHIRTTPEAIAGVRPEDKGDETKELQTQGRRVAMVGDEVNDAPLSVLSVFELSRTSYRRMKRNFGWAAGYNPVSVPLAACVLTPMGFVLPMAVGALRMSASTLVVAGNAHPLRRLDRRPATSVRNIFGR